MELTQFLYTQTHHYSSTPSPPPTTNLHHHHHHVHHRPHLVMPLRNLTVRRITVNRNNFRFNQATESFSIAEPHTSINHRAMAEERKNSDFSQEKADTTVFSVSQTQSADEKGKSSEKSTPVVPPPEKPLPGDCCGSGCVRCVWDVYYEELEEYNKLQKADSKIS